MGRRRGLSVLKPQSALRSPRLLWNLKLAMNDLVKVGRFLSAIGLKGPKSVRLLFGLFVVFNPIALPAKPLNVLLIVIDDLRPELGSYEAQGLHTPNIDRLASKGIKFNNAFCQYPVCNPSRASFLTGKRPDELGILSNKVILREKWPEIVTLPQLFRNNGYFTAGIGKLFHAGMDERGEWTFFRDDTSFDLFYSARGKTPKIGKQGIGRKLGDGTVGWAHWLAAEGGDEAQMDGLVAAQAVKAIEQHHHEAFFIGVGFHKPHDPFVAPKEYFELYPLEEVDLARDPEDRSPLLEYALPDSYNFPTFTDQDRREFKRAYQACTSFTDAQIGKVFAAMDRFDLWDDTMVVLMGDHGYHLGEHGWWNKVTLFDLGARAPFIVWAPQLESMGQATDSVVEFLDLYPTLADYCGLEAPHALSGKSLRSVLEDPATDVLKPAYTQVTRGPIEMGYSVRQGDWRFTQWGKNAEGGVELYHSSQDTNGYYNLIENPEYSDIRARLAGLLREGFPALGSN